MRSAIMLACLAAMILSGEELVAGEIDAPRLFKQLDANDNGSLTRDEAGPAHARLFARLVRTSDEDSDGQLTPAEFAAGLTPVRADKELVEKQGSRLPGSDALIVMLAKMDVNGDSRLLADEIPAHLRGLFATMLERGDDNKNGQLEKRELVDGGPQFGLMAQLAANRLGLDVPAELAKLPPEKRQAMDRMGGGGSPGEMLADPQQAAALFARLDANGDKRLSADEAPGPAGQLIERGDRDGDGDLSEREFQQMARRAAEFQQSAAAPAEVRRNVRQLLKRFDRNQDGKLNADEAPPRMANNFDRLDRNANGLLDGEELQQAAGAMVRLQQNGRKRPKPAADSEDIMPE